MNKAFELAKAEIGTVEWKNGHNPKVVAFFKDSGNPGVTDDETAWCAAFVGAMLRRAGMKSTGALNARSYLDWGKPVDRKDAQPGDVVIFKRGNSSWQGHVAFFVKDRGALLDVLGGNQSDAVNIKGYSTKALLGIRRASDAKAPAKASVPEAITKLGYGTVKDFQRAFGLEVDGIVGPKTTAAMNAAAKPATAQKKAAQAKKPAPASSAKETAKSAAGGLLGGGVALGIVALWDQIKAALGKLAALYDALTPWN
jgi:uncharacterized protein (TIGR02594 family)